VGTLLLRHTRRSAAKAIARSDWAHKHELGKFPDAHVIDLFGVNAKKKTRKERRKSRFESMGNVDGNGGGFPAASTANTRTTTARVARSCASNEATTKSHGHSLVDWKQSFGGVRWVARA
jgi:hypothetical protein